MTTVSRNFLMGLVSFLWQAALSLDRISADDLTMLLKFYAHKSKHNPLDVLQKLGEINHRRLPAGSKQDGRGLSGRILSVAQLYQSCQGLLKPGSSSNVRIADPRLYFAEKALQRLENLLEDRQAWRAELVHDIRIELAHTASLLDGKISPKSRKEISRVFHLNHAGHLRVKSVEEIAGEAWLET